MIIENLSARNLLDIAEFIYIAIDVSGNVIMINQKGCEIFGYKESEMIGKNYFENFLPLDIINDMKKVFSKRIKDRKTTTTINLNPILTKDGEEIHISWNNSVLKDEKGNIVGVLSSGTNITGQIEAENMLQDRERLLNSTFNNTFTLQGILDEKGRIIRANQTALDFAGVEEKDVIGKLIWDTYWWSHSDEEKEKYKNLVQEAANGNTGISTITNLNADKEIRYVFSTTRPIVDENQKVKFIIAEGQDITDLVTAEKLIRESEIRFRSIFNHSNDGYILFTLDGMIQEVNPRILEIIGFEEEEILNDTASMFLVAEYVDLHKSKLKESDKTGFANYKAQIKRKDGIIIPAQHSAIKLNILGEELIFCIVRDISESEVAQDKIRSSEVLYRALFENTGSGIMLIEEDNSISLVNNRLLEMTGYNRNEILRKKWVDFIHKNESKKTIEIIDQWESKDVNTLYFETIYIDKKEEERNIFVSIGKIPDSTQRIVTILDITVEKKLENIMIKSDERLRNLVENVPVPITIMSEDGDLLETNQAHWKLLGYNTKEEFSQAEAADQWINIKDRERFYSLLKKKQNVKNFETRLRKQDGTVFWGSISAITHHDISGDLVSYQIVQDITTQKEIENELRQQIMKFKLEEANLYMVEEEFAYNSAEIFADLLKIGYKGTIFSRTIENRWKEVISKDFSFYKLAEKGKGNIIPPNLEKIEERIEDLPSRQVILLDRLDYLIQKNGFESTLFFIYRLMDLAFLANHIILLSIDTSTLNHQEKNLLGKELKHIEDKEESLIPEDMFEVLMMVYQKNVSGTKPKISEIIDELKISRPTARKRIQNLIDDGLVTETIKGRSKVLQVTIKGKSMF